MLYVSGKLKRKVWLIYFDIVCQKSFEVVRGRQRSPEDQFTYILRYLGALVYLKM